MKLEKNEWKGWNGWKGKYPQVRKVSADFGQAGRWGQFRFCASIRYAGFRTCTSLPRDLGTPRSCEDSNYETSGIVLSKNAAHPVLLLSKIQDELVGGITFPL